MDISAYILKNYPNGFLPKTDPLKKLPKIFSAWEDAATALPKLLIVKQVPHFINQLPDFPIDQLKSTAQWHRAMLILSFMAHAYVFGGKNLADELPEKIAKPWWQIAAKLGRPAVLSYASYALYNWRRIDVNQPIELGNIVLLQNFFGGLDEEWFILVHIDIEAKAAPILGALELIRNAIKQKDNHLLSEYLQIIIFSLTGICKTLDRMPENCDPYIYYNRVRPYIHGWKNNPSLPDGMLYQGVSTERQKFRGETGAQSSIMPMLDAAFGVQHQEDFLSVYLKEMQEYMPPEHRAFVNKMQNLKLREYLQKNSMSNLNNLYNQCIELMTRFRSTHLAYAIQYIQKQHQTSLANPTATGTGGTPFVDYLRKHRDECLGHKL